MKLSYTQGPDGAYWIEDENRFLYAKAHSMNTAREICAHHEEAAAAIARARDAEADLAYWRRRFDEDIAARDELLRGRHQAIIALCERRGREVERLRAEIEAIIKEHNHGA